MRVFQHDRPDFRPVGRVTLVGAGPGDPELLTVKATKAIAAAEIILHDKLVGPGVLALAPARAELIDVGKRCGRHAMKQTEINALLVEHARRGRTIVRLKGGDPFVFGRGGEELEALQEAGIPVDVVPGVTAACAAAASLRMPLTHRDAGRSLHLVSGHGAEGRDAAHDWAALARKDSTLALYMGAVKLRQVSAEMIAAGVPAELPAIAVANATMPDQRHCTGTVATIGKLVEAGSFDGPVLVIFGETVRAVSAMESSGYNGLRMTALREAETSTCSAPAI